MTFVDRVNFEKRKESTEWNYPKPMEKSTRACVSLFDQELQDFMRELRIVGKKLKEFEISSGNEMNEIILIESMNGKRFLIYVLCCFYI